MLYNSTLLQLAICITNNMPGRTLVVQLGPLSTNNKCRIRHMLNVISYACAYYFFGRQCQASSESKSPRSLALYYSDDTDVTEYCPSSSSLICAVAHKFSNVVVGVISYFWWTELSTVFYKHFVCHFLLPHPYNVARTNVMKILLTTSCYNERTIIVIVALMPLLLRHLKNKTRSTKERGLFGNIATSSSFTNWVIHIALSLPFFTMLYILCSFPFHISPPIWRI
jgi:hypothetical protein